MAIDGSCLQGDCPTRNNGSVRRVDQSVEPRITRDIDGATGTGGQSTVE
jgi:hypothetical protein